MGFVQRDEYIEGFFKSIQLQLPQATVKDHSVRYKGFEVAAEWTNGLWHIRVNDSEESIQRHYDPAQANSPDAAASYFVDALRRMNGEEPIPRPQVVRGPLRKIAKNAP
jgi:hypothetical protein